jgi:hypothetical protein
MITFQRPPQKRLDLRTADSAGSRNTRSWRKHTRALRRRERRRLVNLRRIWFIDATCSEDLLAKRPTVKRVKSAILAKRASKGSRGKRTRAQPRQYTVADLKRARDRVAAAERRVDNDYTGNPRRHAGLERAKLELHIVESQLRLRGLLE